MSSRNVAIRNQLFRSSKPHSFFRFLELPKDIKLMVYEQLVDEIDFNIRYRTAYQFQPLDNSLFKHTVKRLAFHKLNHALQILRVCERIYAEAKPMLKTYLKSSM